MQACVQYKRYSVPSDALQKLVNDEQNKTLRTCRRLSNGGATHHSTRHHTPSQTPSSNTDTDTQAEASVALRNYQRLRWRERRRSLHPPPKPDPGRKSVSQSPRSKASLTGRGVETNARWLVRVQGREEEKGRGEKHLFCAYFCPSMFLVLVFVVVGWRIHAKTDVTTDLITLSSKVGG